MLRAFKQGAYKVCRSTIENSRHDPVTRGSIKSQLLTSYIKSSLFINAIHFFTKSHFVISILTKMYLYYMFYFLKSLYSVKKQIINHISDSNSISSILLSSQSRHFQGIKLNISLFALSWLQRPSLNCLFRALLWEGFALSIWFCYCKWFLRTLACYADTDKPKSARKYLFDFKSN